MRINRQTQIANPAVQALSEDLGIDTSLTADQAMLDAAAAQQTANAAEGAVALDQAPDTEQLVDPIPVAPSLTLQNRLAHPPMPEPRTSPAQARENARISRESAKRASPSTKRLGALGAKIPGAEHLKIHLRSERDGKVGFVGILSLRDIPQSMDAESYLSQYIKPKFGPGDYILTGVDARGNEMDGGTLTLLDPIAEPLGAPVNNGLQAILDKLIDRSLNQQQKPIAPPIDPIAQMRNLATLQSELTGGAKGDQQATLAAIIQAQGQQTTAMLQTLLQQQQQPKQDDALLMLLLKSLIEQKSAPATMPMPLPLPPPSSPFEGIKEIAELLVILRPAEPPRSSLSEELLKTLLAKDTTDKMGPREVLQLVKEIGTTGGPSNDFQKSMENLQMLFTAVSAVKQQTEPSAGSGFWEALGGGMQALFSNRALGDAIRQKMVPGSAPAPQRDRLLPQGVEDAAARELEQRADILKNRRLELARKRLEDEQRALDIEIGRKEAREHKAGKQPSAASQPQAEPSIQQQQLSDEQAEAVERVKAANGGQIPALPPELPNYVNALTSAEDEGALVEALVELIGYFEDQPEPWPKFTKTMFGLIGVGNKEQATAVLGSFFRGLIKVNFVTEELTAKVLAAFDAHFEEIAASLEDEDDEGADEGVAGDDDGAVEAQTEGAPETN